MNFFLKSAPNVAWNLDSEALMLRHESRTDDLGSRTLGLFAEGSRGRKNMLCGIAVGIIFCVTIALCALRAPEST
jgi:hypothetical protein